MGRRKSGRADIKVTVLSLMLLVITLPVSTCWSSQTPSPTFYHGKTLNFVLAQAAGSGTDTTARSFIPFLQKTVPGNPIIIIDNKGGAGGATAMHYYLKQVKHDGLSVIMSSSGTVTRWVQRSKGHEYDLTKLRLLLSTTSGRIWFVHSRLGVKNVKELKTLSLARPLKSAHPAADSLPAGVERLIGGLLGLKVEQKYGYADYAPDCFQALLKGEVDLTCTPGRIWNTVLPSVKKGEFIPMFQDGVGPDLDRGANVPDVMSLPETYQYLFGKDPDQSAGDYRKIKTFLGLTLMSPLWIHHDAPPDSFKLLRDGIDKMLHLPEFKRVSIETVGTDMVDNGFIFGDRTDKFLRDFFSHRDEIAELIKVTGGSGS